MVERSALHRPCCAVALQDMEWCQQYAAENRRYMRDIMADIVSDVAQAEPDSDRSVNIHHNYCTCQACSYTVCLARLTPA